MFSYQFSISNLVCVKLPLIFSLIFFKELFITTTNNFSIDIEKKYSIYQVFVCFIRCYTFFVGKNFTFSEHIILSGFYFITSIKLLIEFFFRGFAKYAFMLRKLLLSLL